MTSSKDFIKRRESYLAIDPERLDEEWLQQPVLFDRAQQAVVDCDRMHKASQKSLRELKAELWLKVKKNPDDYGIDDKKSPTVGDIESVLMENKNYIKALDLVDLMELYLTEAKNYVFSIQMKKSAITKLAELWIGNYYATPQIRKPEGGKHFTDFVYERNETKQRGRLVESKNKREVRKSEAKKKIKNKGVQEDMDEALEKEEQNDKPKRDKMLGRSSSRRRKRG